MNPKLMTFKDFAKHIGVSYSTVRRMIAEKKDSCRKAPPPSDDTGK